MLLRQKSRAEAGLYRKLKHDYIGREQNRNFF